MKHADEGTLDKIEDVLAVIRQLPKVKERKRGIFYLKSKAFIHFHADGEDVYADARIEDDDFTRYLITSPEQRAVFLNAVQAFFESPVCQ